MKIFALAAIATGLVAGSSLSQRAAADGLPAWCATKGVAELEQRVGSFANEVRDTQSSDPVTALYSLVTTSCGQPPAQSNDTPLLDSHRDDFAAARQRWSKWLDITEADWTDVAAWAQATPSRRHAGLGTLELPDGADQRAWSSFTPLEQFVFLAGRGAGVDKDLAYWADALEANLSELGRFGFIEQCLEGPSGAKEVRWAVCQQDIDKIFPAGSAGLAGELRAAKATGYQRTIIRLDVARIRDKLPAHAAEVEALRAKDEAYAKVFHVAELARKDWDAHVKADSPLPALISAMDDARITQSRKAYEGCEARTWDAWKAAVAKLPAKTFEGMHGGRDHEFLDLGLEALIKNRDVFLASAALAICKDKDANDYLARSLGTLVVATPGQRGPRTSATTAILDAGIQLDDRNAKLVFPHPNHDGWYTRSFASLGGGGKGVVATTKITGNTMRITFVANIKKQTVCAQFRETSQVSRIDPDGRIIYRYDCLKTKLVDANTAPNPIEVDVRYAAGVKPGVYVEGGNLIVEAVWPNATAKAPSVVFGVPVR